MEKCEYCLEFSVGPMSVKFTVCLRAIVFVSAEVSHIPPGDINSLLLKWQTTLMDRFYSPKSKVERADSLSNAPLRDYCEWKSVKCVDGTFSLN